MATERINFKTYMNNTNFYIPLYQRDFVWKKANIESFINDAIDVLSDYESTRSMFCGTAYIRKNKDNKHDVIDGQQRTTFLYGVKLALQDRLGDLISYLEEKDSRSGAKTLEQLQDITDTLSKFTVETARGTIKQQVNDKKGPIYNVFEAIKKKFNNYFDGMDEDNLRGVKDDIIDFIIKFFTRIELVQVEVKEDDDIHDVFKSINSKGKQLNDWDIIRNDIYSGTSEEPESTLKSIDENLAYLDENFYIKKEEYMQAYLTQNRFKFVKKNNSSEMFDEFLKNNGSVGKFKNDLDNFVAKLDSYNKIELDANGNNELKHYFKIAKELNAVQIKVVSLACVIKWGIENNIPDSLKKSLTSFIIYVSIHGGRANVFEKLFTSGIKEILESDEKYLELLEKQDFYKKTVRLIENGELNNEISSFKQLIKLYIYLNTPSQIRGDVFKRLSFEYEHVLPQQPSEWLENDSSWINTDPNTITEKYIEKIGNIILIHKKLNSKVSNKLFEHKQNQYFDKETEHYIFTKDYDLENGNYNYLKVIFDIENLPNWTPKEIETRTEDLTNLIQNTLITALK